MENNFFAPLPETAPGAHEAVPETPAHEMPGAAEYRSHEEVLKAMDAAIDEQERRKTALLLKELREIEALSLIAGGPLDPMVEKRRADLVAMYAEETGHEYQPQVTDDAGAQKVLRDEIINRGGRSPSPLERDAREVIKSEEIPGKN